MLSTFCIRRYCFGAFLRYLTVVDGSLVGVDHCCQSLISAILGVITVFMAHWFAALFKSFHCDVLHV